MEHLLQLEVARHGPEKPSDPAEKTSNQTAGAVVPQVDLRERLGVPIAVEEAEKALRTAGSCGRSSMLTRSASSRGAMPRVRWVARSSLTGTSNQLSKLSDAQWNGT